MRVHHGCEKEKKKSKHGMHRRVGSGCSCMPMLGIHKCAWVRGDMAVGWGTERRQSESRMTVVRRACTPEQPKTTKKQDLSRRDKGGYSSSRVHTGDKLWGRGPHKNRQTEAQAKKSKRDGREREREREQTTRTDIPANTQNAMHNMSRKNTTTNKNNATKTRNSESLLSSVKDNKRAKEREQKTRKNSKRTQRTPKQETEQRKQQHCMCSKNHYKRGKKNRANVKHQLKNILNER